MKLDLIHLRLPLVHPFETSFGRVTENETLIVRVEEDGIVGWGECPAGAAPFYSHESIDTAWLVLTRHLDDLHRVRGHPMAKAGLEMARLDLAAKRDGIRLHDGVRDEVEAGISLGIEERIEDLLERVDAARGYRRVKIKIKPGWDVDVVAAVRRRYPDLPLMVDANAAYTPADAAHLARLDAFDLMMIEQPLSHDDLLDHVALARKLETPICLDESIRHARDTRHAVETGACRIINIKQARVGGPASARAVHDVAQAAGVPVWCGGMLESGIGRAHNVALASLPNFTLPGDISAGERYYVEDVVDPPFRLTERGTIRVPAGPGLGVTVLEDRLQKYCVRREAIVR